MIFIIYSYIVKGSSVSHSEKNSKVNIIKINECVEWVAPVSSTKYVFVKLLEQRSQASHVEL